MTPNPNLTPNEREENMDAFLATVENRVKHFRTDGRTEVQGIAEMIAAKGPQFDGQINGAELADTIADVIVERERRAVEIHKEIPAEQWHALACGPNPMAALFAMLSGERPEGLDDDDEFGL